MIKTDGERTVVKGTGLNVMTDFVMLSRLFIGLWQKILA